MKYKYLQLDAEEEKQKKEKKQKRSNIDDSLFLTSSLFHHQFCHQLHHAFWHQTLKMHVINKRNLPQPSKNKGNQEKDEIITILIKNKEKKRNSKVFQKM